MMTTFLNKMNENGLIVKVSFAGMLLASIGMVIIQFIK